MSAKPTHQEKEKTTGAVESIKNDQAKGAQRAMLEELFNDYYINRGKVYKMNFFRGIFFALGSVIGGTVVLALIIWLLSLLNWIPFVGEYIQDTTNTIQESKPER